MKKRCLTKLDDLTGVYRIVALTILQEESPGQAVVISEGLINLADKLEGGAQLSSGEVKFLSRALRQVASQVELYGAPFGFEPRKGRRPLVNALERLALGKRVDELHRPERHGIGSPALQLTDNAVRDGAYSRVADEFGLDAKLVERAYAAYLRRVGRE